jgi:hypothetical protein
MSADSDEGRFVAAEQVAGYGRFAGPPPLVEELERFFLLDDADRTPVAKRRGDHNRLGFALQLTTVRYLGTFLNDPIDVPSVVLDFVADRLGIADPSCVKAYMVREMTRFEHRWEISQACGWREFAEAVDELTRWMDHRTWTTGDGPKAIFDGAVGWLRQRQVLLPALDSLTRLVGQVVSAAHRRLWETLLELITPEQARVLLGLLEVGEGERVSPLERLRRGPTGRTATALVGALRRVAEVAGLGVGAVDLSAVPHRRVVDLARVGLSSSATALRRRRPYAKQLATLLATVVYLEARVTDDALELFDVVMTGELLARAERQSSTDKLKRYPRMARYAGRLAAAVGVLLAAGGRSGRRVAGRAVYPAAAGPQVRPAAGRDDRVRRHRRRRQGPDRVPGSAGAAGGPTQQAGAGRLPGRAGRRRRRGAGRVAGPGVHRGPPGGHRGPGRLHLLRAQPVPRPAPPP